MAHSFIGKPISLISHSDVRYRGILAGIDPVASTIQLSNVFSMGTESRRPPDQFIPPVQEPYAYIIFRASEVKDLAVDEPAPRRSVHDDPAVLGASAPIAPAGFPQGPYPPGAYQQQPIPQQVPGGVPPPQQRQQPYPQGQAPGQSPNASQATAAPAQNGAPTGGAQNKKNPVHSATASMETVERALGDLRVSNGNDGGAPAHSGRGGHGGRRGGRHGDAKPGDLRVPTTDFDFQSANARFDKAALASQSRTTPKPAEGAANGENEEAEKSEDAEAKRKEKEAAAYNPKKSFFDSLSSGSNAPSSEGGRGRGGRRGGGGRNRREEERERNVATFGEPGGIGLMGPGAYVGGYGGYGRRGGGRGRRGGPPPNTRQS